VRDGVVDPRPRGVLIGREETVPREPRVFVLRGVTSPGR